MRSDDVQGIADKIGSLGGDIPDITDLTKGKPKKRRRDQWSEKNSELSAAIALKAVGILMRVLRKIGGQLDNWYIRFHTRGFDIADIQIRLRNEKFKEVIAKAISKQFPGARHHFNENPTVYAFLAINNRVGKIIRNKLGLDYAAYDDGAGNVSISITEPPIEAPPDESFVDETEAPPPQPAPEAMPAPGGMAPPAGPPGMTGGIGGAGGLPPLGDLEAPGGGGPEAMPGAGMDFPPEGGVPGAEDEAAIADIAAGMPEEGQEEFPPMGF